jgi:hypothetical protein
MTSYLLKFFKFLNAAISELTKAINIPELSNNIHKTKQGHALNGQK